MSLSDEKHSFLSIQLKVHYNIPQNDAVIIVKIYRDKSFSCTVEASGYVLVYSYHEE